MNFIDSPRASINGSQRNGDSRTMSRLRPHCFEASMIDLRNRDNFDAPGSTTDRSVTIGIKRSTPSSVAFSTSQSNRSPLGTAVASVSAERGRPLRQRWTGDRQFDPVGADGDDLGPRRQTSAVKDLDEVAHAQPADAIQVPGLVGLESCRPSHGGSGQ